jgi:2-haloacid dehalogenase
VTFDCFGTLVDWRHGIATSADLVAPGRGAELLERYNAHEMDVQAERPFRRYRDVLAEGLRRAAADLRVELAPDDAGVLAATIPHWPVFPEVPGALGELRDAGWRLALLTNCDRDIIGATQRKLGVTIDAVVTAEAVGSYKPALGHFRRFTESFGVEPGDPRWVHVAQSHVHDVVPAHGLGLPSVWVNRLGEDHDPSLAGAVLPDLHGLAATIARLGG